MTTWTPESTPFDGGVGLAYGVGYSPDLELLVAAGQSDDGATTIATSVDGVTWTPRGNPFGTGGYGDSVAWSPTLGLFVAVGGNDANDINAVTSPDGVAWTSRGNVFANTNVLAFRVVRSEDQGVFLAGGICSASGHPMAVSTDGVAWTPLSTIFNNHRVLDFAYSPTLSLWVAAGQGLDGSFFYAATSPDGVTWTKRTAPGSGLVSVCWSPLLSMFVALGYDGIVTSPEGVVWTARSSPFDTTSAIGMRVTEAANDRVIAVGSSGDNSVAIIESPDAVTWVSDPSAFNGSSATDVVYAPELALAVVTGQGPGF